jgi:cysteine desulfurase
MVKVYLDNHTATRPHSKAVDHMLPFYREKWGSLLAPHQMGEELYPSVDAALAKAAALLGMQETDQFFLAGNGIDAVSQILWAHYFEEVRETGKNHLLTTVVEDASILLSFNGLEKVGCSGKMLPVDAKGRLTKSELEAAIRPRTSLLSLSWAHGLTGVIQPLEEISAVCRKHNIRLHVDVSTVLGKLYFRFEDLQCDYLSFDGEKIHAPQGTAAVMSKKTIAHAPNFNVPGLVALSTALEHAYVHFDHLSVEIARLRNKLEGGVEGSIVLFKDADRLPNTAVIAFPGVHAEALLFYLNQKGVFATCGGGNSQKLSQVLQASGVSSELAQCALSFSLSYETTEEEIDFALDTINAAYKKLRIIGGSL